MFFLTIKNYNHNILLLLHADAMKTLAKHYTRHSVYANCKWISIKFEYNFVTYQYAGVFIFFKCMKCNIEKSIKVAPSKYPVEYSTALVSVCLIISSINLVLLEALIKLNILTTGLLITIKIATDSISTMGLKKTNFFTGWWEVNFFFGNWKWNDCAFIKTVKWYNVHLIPDLC